ncbi:MAG: PHP domain-containing protein, partial [Methanomassiliicoccales archaeon]|nr:PHP domain-containing protein [Methanomassiliicoccales archaeon]
MVSNRIRFESPDLGALAGEGLAAVDMHLHTDHSDAATSVERALAKARQDGFGLAVTDHNEISGSLKAFAEARGTIVIPGIEVSAADGPHILAYFHSPRDLEDFYDRHIAPQKRSSPWLAIRSDTPTIAQALEKYACLAVAAHPYGYLMFNKGLQKCIDLEYLAPGTVDGFDGFEVICGGMAHSLNLKAVALVERKGKCFTGGTD